MTKKNLLKGRRVYLSGPMDFVMSRLEEKKYGWRNRVGDFLRSKGVTVFDPWNKPVALGLEDDYGRGGESSHAHHIKKHWSLDINQLKNRERWAKEFREVQHVELRMVDTCDFLIAYCPTNIYSVGTPHEIVIARQQHKPVLIVSPPVVFPAHAQLKKHLRKQKDKEGLKLLKSLEQEIPIKPNKKGAPSLWYLSLVGPDRFFDGFGFVEYGLGTDTPSDQQEKKCPPTRSLLEFLENVDQQIPIKWDFRTEKHIVDKDWLLFDI